MKFTHWLLLLCVLSLALSPSQAGESSHLEIRTAAVQQLQAAGKPCGHMRLHPSTARRLLQKKYQLSPDPDNRGCWLYRATMGDTMEAIARGLGVSLQELKETNAKNIADFSRINGRFIQICNIKNFDNAEGMGGGPLATNQPPRASASNAPTPAPAPAPAPKAEPAPAPKAEPAPAPKAEPAPAPKAAPAPAPKQEPPAEPAPARAPAPASGPAAGRPAPGGVSLPVVGNVLPGLGTGGTGVGLPVLGVGRRML